jgi:hypothetical protein
MRPAELRRLCELLGEDPPEADTSTDRISELNARLIERIRNGDVDEALFDHVVQTLRDELAVARPGFDTRLEVE